MMGGPGSMRGRGGRAGIPMRGRMPGPPNMRGGRGGRGGFRPGEDLYMIFANIYLKITSNKKNI